MDKNNIEITRSYSRKIQTGEYTNADFFCSAKMECNLEARPEVSELLDNLCQQDVEKSISDYRKGPNVGKELWDEHKQSLENRDSVLRDINNELQNNK